MFSKDLGLSEDLINAVREITEASCASKKMEKEELHPNQKVLDKNKNGKLDADDFKLLRAKKSAVEEAKDGWSKDDSLAKPVTSGQAMANHSQYFTKVTKLDSDGNPKKPEKLRKEEEDLEEGIEAFGLKATDAQRKKAKEDGAKYVADTLAKRKKIKEGMEEFAKAQAKKRADAKKAKEKMSCEEVEELDELDQATYMSYLKKAPNDAVNKAIDSTVAYNSRDMKKSVKLGNKVDKRLAGISKATDKLTKEQVEELDELKLATYASYAKKGIDDYTNRETRISRALDNSNKMFLDPNINKAAVKQANRKIGINRAIDKLTKEQVEEIEMLAAKHGLGE